MQPSETNKVSIVDAIRRGNYEASIVTTYNAYLPYYEEVFLKYLHSAGCRHNVLLMDAARFGECINEPGLRPRSAGFSYSLIPINTKGAFHPKLVLLLSRTKGLLFVGSHNMTLSGMGLNNELTTRIEIIDRKQRQGIAIAKDAWQFVEKWVDFNSEQLPKPLLDAFYALKRFGPWLNKSEETLSAELRFFGSDPSGDPLWNNISNIINSPVRKIHIIGPFFDHKLAFIDQLKVDLNPTEFIIGIKPNEVSPPEADYEKNGIQYVDTSKLQKSSGYLHAKAIYIESTSGDAWLITGSANPSKNAWTSTPSGRNAEAVILHIGKIARDTANNLGISQIDQLPEIDNTAWDRIRGRTENQKPTDKKADMKHKCLIGIATDKGIQIPEGGFEHQDFTKAICIDENDTKIKTIYEYKIIDRYFCVFVQENIANIRFLELILKEGSKSIICLIHHESEINRRSVSSQQAQFRRTMASLQSDNPDLENLILTIEKIIFEEPVEIEPSAKRKKCKKATRSQTDEEISTLAIDIKETKIEKRRKRLVTSGGIGHLIDVLVHHLGIELDKENDGTDEKGRNEEELVGTDDDDNDKENDLIDIPKVVKICNGKVRRLITKMIKTFAMTSKKKSGYDQCLMKLLAVLALLRELRVLDCRLEGIPYQQSLFPEEERIKLLTESLKYLYGNEYQFLNNTDNELIDAPWDELSRLHGLLLWLTHDCGADFRDKKGFSESIKDRDKRLFRKSYLVLVTPSAVTDRISFEEAKKSVNRTTDILKKSENRQWFKDHYILGSNLKKRRKKAHKIRLKNTNKITPGQVVFVRDSHNLTFHVVMRKSGKNITITDIGKQDGKSLYPAEMLVGFK
ncbi:hypothetical protein QUF75_05785 [Desulfococcaceae bacterium HSG7]|nr:hypothetical protein [Desulfococcaceae bacterium HSG7]